METLLLLIPLLACPLMMAAMGAIGWLWAKAGRRSEEADEHSTPATPPPGEAAPEGA